MSAQLLPIEFSQEVAMLNSTNLFDEEFDDKNLVKILSKSEVKK
jgi:hypothetical protein